MSDEPTPGKRTFMLVFEADPQAVANLDEAGRPFTVDEDDQGLPVEVTIGWPAKSQVHGWVARLEAPAAGSKVVIVPPEPKPTDFESPAAYRWARLHWDRAFGDVAHFESIRLAGGRTETCRHGYGFADSCPVCDNVDDVELAERAAARAERELREWIGSRKYGPGAKLPSRHALTVVLGVGRGTVQFILRKLAAEGLVEAVVGKGTFVAPAPKD